MSNTNNKLEDISISNNKANPETQSTDSINLRASDTNNAAIYLPSLDEAISVSGSDRQWANSTKNELTPQSHSSMIFLMFILNFGLKFGAAQLDTLEAKDRSPLRFDGYVYSVYWIVALVGYIVFQLPVVVLVGRQYRPRYLLLAILLLSGIVGIGYQYIRISRWYLLAVVYAILLVLDACWSPRFQLGFRMTVLYQAVSISEGLSPTIASLLRSSTTLSVSQWKLVIIGIVFLVCAFLALFIQDFPTRVIRGRESSLKQDPVHGILEDNQNETMVRDSHLIWALGLAYGCANVSMPALSKLKLKELSALGFNSRAYFVIVPWFIAAIIALAVARYSDRSRIRSPYILSAILTCMVGFACMFIGYFKAAPVSVFGIFLAIVGYVVQLPLIMAMLQNNICGTATRARATMIIIGFGVIGFIICRMLNPIFSSTTYLYVISMATQAIAFMIIGATTLRLRRTNAQLGVTNVKVFESPEGQDTGAIAWKYTL
ncbi:transport protein [Ceratobasidium theobromae]|uniref:Transport protein n=1 Tax=Ceratobasidium theobromae TaxID=1582974 RepID=A0A5N5Q9F1_9AGAM|nr:transport protein [Ceratobasidium theobromae]